MSSIASVQQSLRALLARAGVWRRAGWNAVVRGWSAVRPGPSAWKGAAVGSAVGVVAIGGVMGLYMGSGLGLIADIAANALFGALCVAAAALVVALLSWLLRRLPMLFGAVLVGSVAVVLAVFSEAQGLVFAAFVLIAASSGAVTAALLAGAWKSGGTPRRVFLSVWLAAAVASGGALLYWMSTPGWLLDSSPLADTSPAPPQIAAPDPSLPGAFHVRTLTYGSGTDSRPEYGKRVGLKTAEVDASRLLTGLKGFRAKLRRWYWGFDEKRFPLNARVWYPEGEGPFPLVLIVHGNHKMEEFSEPGYAYLGELFASRGIITASVDENFLNGTWSGDLQTKECPTRAWLLLEHLKAWRDWNANAGNPFFRKVDLNKVALIGHSRGGEAVAHAAVFNRMSYYPSDANVKFGYRFGIRAVIAIAPADGQYQPAGMRAVPRDVNYLVLQGSQDADVSSFVGVRQFQRVEFAACTDCFKAAVWIHRANHGQFNTVWGRADFSPPMKWFLNLRPNLAGDEQRRIGKVFMSAFLEASLARHNEYRALFRDARAGRNWLPRTTYLTRYGQAGDVTVAGYDEDYDLESATAPGAAMAGVNLVTWKEDRAKFRDDGPQLNNAAVLGWNRKDSKAPVPLYTMRLAAGTAKQWKLGPGSSLLFSLANGDAVPYPPDAKPDSKRDEKFNKEAIDLDVELSDEAGVVAQLPLSRVRVLAPSPKSRFTKWGQMEKRYKKDTETVLASYAVPLDAFLATSPKLDLSRLEQVRFRFDRTMAGTVILDDLGFRPAAAGAGAK